MTRSKWFLPAFSVFLGLVCLGAFWLGGKPGDGVRALGLMSVLALVFLLGGRSETIRALRGDGRDEYWERIDVHASALSGFVMIGVVLGLTIWEWAHGRDGSPYAQLCALAGLSYVAALAFLRWRS